MSEQHDLAVDEGIENPQTVARAHRPTFHEIISIDRREPIVAFAQTTRGRLLIVTLFTLLLMRLNGWPMVIVGGACQRAAL